jgi:hypothetical protein
MKHVIRYEENDNILDGGRNCTYDMRKLKELKPI